MEEQQQVTIHRTFANGQQIGYGRDGDGFRIYERDDEEADWRGLRYWDRSWVALADKIATLPEREDDVE